MLLNIFDIFLLFVCDIKIFVHKWYVTCKLKPCWESMSSARHCNNMFDSWVIITNNQEYQTYLTVAGHKAGLGPLEDKPSKNKKHKPDISMVR